MIGRNTLQLNNSEIMRAIEYYLNNVQFKEPVLVTSVKEDSGNHLFNIQLEEATKTLDDETLPE